jgi:hypothetical protein
MKISVDHPQFEDFLEDGAITNNQTKSEFFVDIFKGLFVKEYKEGRYSNEEVLKRLEVSSTNESIDISKYELSDVNQNLIVKHLANDDFDRDSLEFKYIEG